MAAVHTVMLIVMSVTHLTGTFGIRLKLAGCTAVIVNVSVLPP